MKFKDGCTKQGFAHIPFEDSYGAACSIQKSSLATQDAIWIGVDDANPKILKPGEGWVPYEVPDEVLLTTRMHLTQEQVKAILPILQVFAETGEIKRGKP